MIQVKEYNDLIDLSNSFFGGLCIHNSVANITIYYSF